MLAMVVSSLCFPMLGVVVRAVRQQDDVFTVMFFSGLLNCIALWTVLLVREKRGAFRTSIPHVHLIRGALGALGATSIVYSMKFVQVDLALTVLMSSPVWSALLARFWLKEELNWATWLAIGLGFCGILITANPGVEGINLWVLLILVPAVGMSLQNTMMTRYTGLGESPWKWSAFNELGILVSSCLLWFSLERTFVDLESAWLYLLIPAFLLPAVYFVSYAFLNGRASVIAPLGYVQLPTAALYGWLVFEETPENKTYYGALLIILAGLILIRFAPKSKYP